MTFAAPVLFIGSKLLVVLRDNYAHIPFPDLWNLPGGGREGTETPLQILKREVMEEVGLNIPEEAIMWHRRYSSEVRPRGFVHFYVAHLPAATEADIVFGEEGQKWRLMTLGAFLALDRAVPSFAPRLRDWLAESASPDFDA